MLRNYYTIYDKVARQYGDLMFCSSDEVAKREFVNIIRKYHINKDDMSLYFVGVFNDSLGYFDCPREKRLVIAGKDVNVPNIEGLEEVLFRLSTLEKICADKEKNNAKR